MTALDNPAITFLTKDRRPGILRPAAPGDGVSIVIALGQVAAEGIYLAAETARWTPTEMEEIIASMTSHPFILVAEINGELVGHAFLQRGTLAKNRHTAGIGMLIIEEFRGIGIGTQMLEYAEAWGIREGLRKLYLSVFSTNARAYRLYRKTGFTDEGRRPEQFLLYGQPVDEILMGKFLPTCPIVQTDESLLR